MYEIYFFILWIYSLYTRRKSKHSKKTLCQYTFVKRCFMKEPATIELRIRIFWSNPEKLGSRSVFYRILKTKISTESSCLRFANTRIYFKAGLRIRVGLTRIRPLRNNRIRPLKKPGSDPRKITRILIKFICYFFLST